MPQVQSEGYEFSGRLEYQRPYLYPGQFAAIFDPRRYSIIEASTKAGKTAGCIVWIFEEALQGQDGWNYWWVAPVSNQADIAFRRCIRAIPQGMATVNLTLKTITLFTGSVIWFKSGDKPDSLYGEDVYAAVVDEASRLKEDAWYAVRSTLTATRGRVRIIGNVKGRKNWFYGLARRAQAGEEGMGYHKLTAYDAVAAGVLAQEEVDDAKRTLPEMVFNALYLAEPGDDEGNPFGIAAIRKCCISGITDQPPVTWGWDFAKKQDWTVGTGLDKNGSVCRWARFRKPWDDTVNEVRKSTGHVPALCDSTGVGDPIVEFLQKTPGATYEGYTFSPGSKQRLMEGLALAIAGRLVTFPGDPTGVNPSVIQSELEEFEYQFTKTGVRYSAPEGHWDDCVMSLALAQYHRQVNVPPQMRVTDEMLKAAARAAGMR